MASCRPQRRPGDRRRGTLPPGHAAARLLCADYRQGFGPPAASNGKRALVTNQACRLRPTESCRLDELALEKVEAVRLQMVEHVLEVADIPGLGKLQGVESLYEHPLGGRRRGRDAVPGHVCRKGKDVVVVLVSEQIDDHPSS